MGYLWDIYRMQNSELAHLMGICSTGIVKSWNFTVKKKGIFMEF